MTPGPSTNAQLLQEVEQLRQRLEEAEATVRAIRGGEVDAFLVANGADDHVLVLDGVDRPYRAIIEQMQQGAVTVSSEGAILYVNARFAEMAGRPAADLLGSDVRDCAPTSDRAAFAALIAEGTAGAAQRELELSHADGTLVPVHATISPVTLGSGVLCLILTELTEQKRQAAERERYAQERAARGAAEITAAFLRDADRRKDEFLAMLAHELRTPLTPLRNGLEILNRAGSDEQQVQLTREMMGRQVEMLVRLVDDLLDVGRVTQGKIELQRQPVDLRTVVQMAVESARGAILERGHRLDVALPEEPLPVHADVVRVAQIVINLLNNAAKFTPRGGNVRLAVERAGDFARVRVRDDGIGIAPEALPRMFELFVQADPSVSRTEGGLGIGLTLARRLAEVHGGRLEGESAGLGRGSEFTLHFPLAAAAGPQGPPPAAERRASGTSRLRVLIVDDNRDSVHSLAFLLRMGGHEVHQEFDGLRALAAAVEFGPDLVLLDIGLPGMDGYEVARRLKTDESTRDAAIVAVSGYGSEEDRARSRAAGFLEHLVKPIDFAALDAVFAQVAPRAAKGRSAGSTG